MRPYRPAHKRVLTTFEHVNHVARIQLALVIIATLLVTFVLPARAATTLTSVGWSSNSALTNATGARYDYNFMTATTTTASRVTASVPAGTSCSNRYLALNGSSGNGASTPDSVANSVTGDIDLRSKVSLNSWSPTNNAVLLGKWDTSASKRSYMLRISGAGSIEIWWSSDGTTGNSATSLPTGFADGTTNWVRATLQVNTGSQSAVKFYTSSDGASWSQLGTTQNYAITSIYDTDIPVQVGYRSSSSIQGIDGKLYYAEIRNGVGGTVVNSFDPSLPGVTSSPNTWTSASGETWTLDRTGSDLPADIACPLTVSSNTNIGAGTAVLRMYDSVALYSVTSPASVSSGTAVSLGLTGFTNTATSGSYASTISEYDNSGTPVLISNGTSANSVALAATWAATSLVPAAAGAQYDYGFITGPSTTTVSKVAASIPSGTSGTSRYVDLPGYSGGNGSGNYLSTPDSAANSLTSEIDIRTKVNLIDWTPATTAELVDKRGSIASTQKSYAFEISTSGNLIFNKYGADCSTGLAYISSVATGITDGSTSWVRTTWKQNNGGVSEAKFYTSSDGTTWTQLGTTRTNADVTAICDGTARLDLGSRDSGTLAQLPAAKFYYADIRSTIDGTVVNKMDASEDTVTSPSSWTSSTGETWTITRAGTVNADLASDLTVPANTGIGAGTAKLRFIDGKAVYTVSSPASVSSGTTINLSLAGITNVSVPVSPTSTIQVYNNATTPAVIDTLTTNSLTFDQTPTTPSSIAQKTSGDVVIATGGALPSNTVKFTASISDPDPSDTLSLCVEVKPIGTAFTNAETGCGSTVAYSGTPVSASYSYGSLSSNTAYHWQARTKDSMGNYSSWISYGSNSDAITADPDFHATTLLTSVSWAASNQMTGRTGNSYDYNFTTASSATLSKVTASVPAGTSGGTNRYLALTGTSGNNVSTPDSAANSVTSTIDLRAKVRLADWTPSTQQDVIAKYASTANQRSYMLQIGTDGKIWFRYSPDGSASANASSTVATGVTDNTDKWIRVTFEPNDGAGGKTANFYLSDDGSTWTQLGTTVTTAGTTSIYDSTAAVMIGEKADNTDSVSGRVYYADVRSGIGGTIVAKFDPTEATAASPSTWTSSTSAVWTVTRTTSNSADLVNDLTVGANTGIGAGTANLRMIDAAIAYSVTSPASVSASTAVHIQLSGLTNTATAGSYSSTIVTYDNSATPVGVDSSASNSLSFVDNTAPQTPTSLVQKTTGDVVISTGTWQSSRDVKFTASASDSNSTDTIYLCIEKKALGIPFANTEDSCGTGVAYSGSAVAVTDTITSMTDDTAYHWQARIKDAGGLYSSWVSYDVNAESARDFGIDSTPPTTATVYDGTGAGVDASYNDGSLSSLSANWGGFSANASGLNKYQYSIGTSAGGTQILGWTDNSTATSVTASGLTLHTGITYFVNVRATDNAGNVSAVASSNGQAVAPTLTFGVSTTSISLNLAALTSYTDTGSITLTTSTNAYNGYTINAYSTQPLTNGLNTISNYGSSVSSPSVWSGTGFGYNVTGGAAIAGFSGSKYAGFGTSASPDTPVVHSATVSGTPITAEAETVTIKAVTNAVQASGSYSTSLVWTCIPSY